MIPTKTERYTIRLGDSYKGPQALLKEVPDQSIDFILTDPPYNLDEYATEIEIKGRENLSKTAEWDRDFDPKDVADEFQRVLKPHGNMFAFTSFNVFGRWWEIFNPRYDTFNFFTWCKTNPPTSFRKSSFLNGVEQIVCAWDQGHLWNFTTQADMKNWLSGPICMGRERLKDANGDTLHPTQKPVYLLRKFVELCTRPGDVILDPFAGVMSVGVAALELGRRFVGFENDTRYFEPGRKRLEEAQTSITVRML